MAVAQGFITGKLLNSYISSFAGVQPRFNEQPQVYARDNSSSSSSSSPSVNIFIDGGAGAGYAASVISACSDQTVYALQCTQAPASLPAADAAIGSYLTAACEPGAGAATVTEGPSTYIFSSAVTTQTMGINVDAIFEENCALAGSSAATCTASLSFSASTAGVSTSTEIVVTTTLSGSDYNRYNVPLTAGADATASATGTCKSGAASSLAPRALLAYGMGGMAALVGLVAM